MRHWDWQYQYEYNIYKDNHNEEIIAEQIEIQIEIHFKTDIQVKINEVFL